METDSGLRAEETVCQRKAHEIVLRCCRVAVLRLEKCKEMNRHVKNFQPLQDSITEWADSIFGKDRKPEYILQHLKKEIEELIKEPSRLEEYADVGILWLNSAAKAGHNVDDLYFSMVGKMMVNKSRKWGKPDENGVVEHLREDGENNGEG